MQLHDLTCVSQVQAWVSLCRAEKFLSVPEVIQPDTVADEGFVIRAVDASFSWSDTGLCIAALVNSEWILITVTTLTFSY